MIKRRSPCCSNGLDAGLHKKSSRLTRPSCTLRPDTRIRPRNYFGRDEEDLIVKLHALLGNRWSLIAGRLPGRTETEVINYWNSHIKRKLIGLGIDPNNHRPNQTLLPGRDLVINAHYKHDDDDDDYNTKCDKEGLSDATSCLPEDKSNASLDLNLELTLGTSLTSTTTTSGAADQVALASSDQPRGSSDGGNGLEGSKINDCGTTLLLFT